MIKAVHGHVHFLHRVLAEAGHQQAGAGHLADNGGVGHRQHRRGIHQHQVVALRQLLHQLLEARVHQQLGRVRRHLAPAQEVQVLDLGAGDHRVQVGLAGQNRGQTVAAIDAKVAVQMAFAHVRVHHHHFLSHLGQHRGQVGGDKGLAHLRTGAGDHQHLVAGFHGGEVQAGAQAAQGLHRQIARVVHRQQRSGLAGGAALAAAQHVGDAVTAGLLLGERHGGVHRNAQFLQLVGGFDAPAQQAGSQHHRGCEQKAEGGAEHQNEALFRRHRCRVDHRVVDDAHVAHGAGLENTQLLGPVKQAHIELLVHFHVAHQAQDFLLGLRQIADLIIDLRLLAFQGAALLQQGAVGRVLLGVAGGHLAFLDLQIVELGVHVHQPAKQRASFHVDVHGVSTGAVGIQFILGLIEGVAHLGELLVEKLQAVFRFRRLTLHVLHQVGLTDGVEDGAGAGRVRAGQADI